jgi:DNA-binding protein HU-beta
VNSEVAAADIVYVRLDGGPLLAPRDIYIGISAPARGSSRIRASGAKEGGRGAVRRRRGRSFEELNREGCSMNKQELCEAVARELDTSKAFGERCVNAFFSSFKAGLKKDKNVQLVGFGTFTVKSRGARTGRNPQTGEEIKIKPSKTVAFRCSKALKDEL